MWQKELQKALQAELKNIKSRNPSFTLRSFAKRLGLSAGALSEILSGKRRTSLKMTRKILQKLNWTDEQIQRIVNLALDQNNTSGTRTLVPQDAFEVVTQWYYFAILSVYDTDRKPQSTEELAQRLGISSAEARSALELLLKYGFLIKEPNGRIANTNIAWRTTDEIPSEIIVQSHMNGLDLAKAILSKVPAEKRDYISLTFAADASNIDLAKKEIRKFKDRIEKIMGRPSNSVFRLNIQLFPVDRHHSS